MTQYWVTVACADHVQIGKAGGFIQVCHGKSSPLKRMAPGDWIVCYSPTHQLGQRKACQAFTALGQLTAEEPYQVRMTAEFHPWRRHVVFREVHPAPIQPLLEQLSFIPSKIHWGFPFRRGCFEITHQDFTLIAAAMGGRIDV